MYMKIPLVRLLTYARLNSNLYVVVLSLPCVCSGKTFIVFRHVHETRSRSPIYIIMYIILDKVCDLCEAALRNATELIRCHRTVL